jgi:hypothetical protein
MPDKKPSQISPENLMLKWIEEQGKRLETSRAELTQLLSMQPKIAQFTVEYSGSCDDGQVEELTAYDDKNNPLPLQENVRDAVEALVDELLAAHCSGWELDAGSSGRITIDARTLQGTIEHNWVVTQSHDIEF